MDLHNLSYPDVLWSVNNHYDYVNSNFLSKDNNFTPIYISPYGSMNYGIFKPNISDVDTKLIILPSYEQLVWGKCFSTEYKIPNGELCNVMDIRHYINNLLKQSINFLETLFSNYGQETNITFFLFYMNISFLIKKLSLGIMNMIVLAELVIKQFILFIKILLMEKNMQML